jgi:hypothetical protein
MTARYLEDIPAELREHARGRTKSVATKLERAMAAIELEIGENDGLYPFNKGSLNQAEVCRRAGVDDGTLQGKSHKKTTRMDVKRWLVRVRTGLVSGRKNVRRTVTERATQLKDDLNALAHTYNLAELELVDARIRILELEAERDALLAEISRRGSNVRSLPPKKGG